MECNALECNTMECNAMECTAMECSAMGPTTMERRRRNSIELQCHGTHNSGAQENEFEVCSCRSLFVSEFARLGVYSSRSLPVSEFDRLGTVPSQSFPMNVSCFLLICIGLVYA